MAAKILIERKIKPELMGSFLEISLELRALAMRQHGYISGETLVSADQDDLHLVISTWRSYSDWLNWEKNEKRIEIAKRMDEFLLEPPVVRAFIDLWGSAAP